LRNIKSLLQESEKSFMERRR